MIKKSAKKRTRTLFAKALVFLAFIVLALFLVQNADFRAHMTKESMQSFVEQFGVFGPVIYIIIYALGVTFLFPATIFTVAGAFIFGTLFGTVYTIIGATVGAILAFFVARTLARDFARYLVGDRLRHYDAKIKKHGFATIFYLRMIFFPFNLLNYGAGITRVKFTDYLLATFFGIIPAVFVVTFFVSKLTDITSWKQLISVDVFFAVVLFIFSFFIPAITKKYFWKAEKVVEKKVNRSKAASKRKKRAQPKIRGEA